MPARVRFSHRVKERAARTRRAKAPLVRIPEIVGPLFWLAVIFFIGFLAFKLYSAWQNRVWMGARITIIVAAREAPRVYSYNPENQSLTTFEIPKNTQLDASGGYGTWLVGSLWDLGSQEKVGGEILKNSVQKSLGIPVDGWMDSRGGILFDSGKFGFLGALGQVFQMRGIKTNLTIFDKFNLLLSVGRVGRFSRTDISLLKKNVIERRKLSDGVEGYLVIPERTTTALDVLRDDRIFSEMKTIKISNATQKSGLGGEVSRVVSVMGLRVIDTGSIGEEHDGTCILIGEEEDMKSLAAQRVAQIYGCQKVFRKPAGAADLEFVIGEGFLTEF